jgi:hypothetical protein
MGVLLFLIYDDSPEQARTRKLVDGAIGLFTSMLFLVSMPMIKPFRGKFTSLLAEVGLTPPAAASEGNEELP